MKNYLRERLFEGNILLAETYCYYKSGRKDANLRPTAPKAPHRVLVSLGFKAISEYLRILA